MSHRRILPAFLIVAAAAALLFGLAAGALGATTTRPTSITKAFDYFHSKQQVSGGFADSGQLTIADATPWTMMAIAAGRENVTAWNKSGKDPLDFMQATDLETKARGSMNAPAFYAKAILAYRAIGRTELIWSAGTPRIDLLAKLLLYRADDGHFSPATSGDRSLNDVNTTTWALLALRAANQPKDNPDYPLVSSAASWLVAAQNGDGGWSTSTGSSTSTVDQTAAAVQALVAAGDGSSAAVQDAVAWLKAHQHGDGGFPSYTSDVRSNAESTAWALQAGIATGTPLPGWSVGGKTPASYLRGLQRHNGSFFHRNGVEGFSPLMTTTQVAIALAGEAFPFVKSGGTIAVHFLPAVTDFKPSGGASFTSTNDVEVSARYGDNKGGTGADEKGVSVYIDGVNKTKSAKIGSATVGIKLLNVPNGTHTVEIRATDRAGNATTVKHTFTVSVSTPTSPTTPPSNPGGGTYYPTKPPTPSTTLYPTPTTTPATSGTPVPTTTTSGSVTGTVITPTTGPGGSPLPNPSASATNAAAGGTNDSGSGGVIGGTLLVMLPAGAAASYLVHRRQVAALTAAGQGKVLPGGGTPWQRFKARMPWSS